MNAPIKPPAPGIERHDITGRDQWLKLREQDVTASVAGALIGVHEYIGPLGLWEQKTGRRSDSTEENAVMKRGRLMEKVAVELIKEKHPEWEVSPPNAYYRDPACRLGATPDLFAVSEQGLGNIQIKSVDYGVFKRKWQDAATGEVQPPLWIAVQSIIEAHLTGAQWTGVAALVGFNLDLHMVPVPIHDGIIERIKSACATFWQQVEAGEKPTPDYARDGEVIARLYGQTNGSTLDLTGDNLLPEILDEDGKLAEIISTSEKRRKEIKAEILAKMGEAEFAKLNGWTISAKVFSRKGYEVKPTTYRTIKSTRIEA